ncbi:MAG: carbohydrate-binding protein [Verrucomicrobiota bacterium]
MKQTRAALKLGLVALAASAVVAARASEPIHVTYLWHMHQPIYFPYESPQTIDANGRFNFSVQGVINDRTPNYTSWPKDAVQQGADRSMAHAGAQCSFSGSLGENLNNMWGGSWPGDYRWARNGLRTSRNNPRLDMVGIPYHHSLMPLTCKEAMKMQIRLHKEQYKDLWNTGGDYSKGFWPPECAFAESIIPALVEEGMEWVIVDNGHLFRAVEGFPWNSGSSCRPNPADVLNPSAEALGSQWVQLQNVWAPTKVLAPWAYQPHYVQHVNPWNGTIQKIVAVPAGRYEGNENGRGGYGAFKPENVWGAHVSAVNNNAQHPMLLLCHSDGDNYGLKNSDAWHAQHGYFLDMCQNNNDFENTTVQDYLQMYPPDPGVVIHVEPGSWVGIDGGTPYFEKWLSSTYVNGENPDHWSWSVLVAAQNRVILADSLENSYSMNDVEWGIGSDTAKAWHFYLNGETSCYWYWDLDRGNPWDGNATRACNTAVWYADQVIGRHPGVDTNGPSLFPPQRNSYNPGGYMWNEATPASSDFEVWTYVYDVNTVAVARLYWRTDKDGRNPISSIQNETYFGGGEVNAWNTQTMTNQWDPKVKGPDNIVPEATYRAEEYRAPIAGQNNVLIDYFVEAVDGKGNTNRSDILHVFVGLSNVTTAVDFTPAQPQDCGNLVTRYAASGRPLSNASPVYLKIAFDNFATAASNYVMSSAGTASWIRTNAIPSGSTNAIVYFRNTADESGTVDNNNGDNWSVAISHCQVAAAATFSPPAPSGCDPVEITYAPNDGVLSNAAEVRIHIGYNGWQGVLSPDPAMTKTGVVWKHTYSPPPGTYQINCCFNNGAGTWDNNSGSDYGVSVTNCAGTNSPVVFSPAAPRDCDTDFITTTYTPAGRPLSNASPVYVSLHRGLGWEVFQMAWTNSAWVFSNGVASGTAEMRVFFANSNASPTIVDGGTGQYWSVAVSSCSTGGPSSVAFSPASPVGCGNVGITYHPNQGPLKTAAQVYIHVGRNNWQDVTDVAMGKVGSTWTYTYSPPEATEQINCCFQDGSNTWDNNGAQDWSVVVVGCTGAVAQAGIRLIEGSPTVTDDAGEQNNIGDNFDLNKGGGYAQTSNQAGFGSFGRVYVNYDPNNFYIGGIGCDMAGSNNAMIIFLGFNTLPDDQPNLWGITGFPSGLDFLHNVTFAKPVDIAIVIGDEYGDGTFTNFNLGDGYDFGQGVFYLSRYGRFDPVAGARLSQFDGTGTLAVTATDMDGSRLMLRWECGIPLASLGCSTNGIGVITNCVLAGLVVNTSTNNQDRYISGNYLARSASPTSSGNYGFSMVDLNPIEVGMALADSDGDGISDGWEMQYFASLAIASAVSDWDTDHSQDRDESYAGTNPKDAVSYFRLYSPLSSGSTGFVVRWHSVSGRQYGLFRSTDLVDTEGGFQQLQLGIPATAPENVYTDATSGAAARFYRVRTQP